MKQKASIFFKGMVIGGSMLVPGVSGGTMAMLLNIYDELIGAITSLTKRSFQKLPFLIAFGLGALAGFALLATPLSWLVEHYPKPTLYFFVGAVIGGVPVMFKEAGIKSVTGKTVLTSAIYIAIGFVLVISLRFLPPNLLQVDLSNGIGGYLILFGAGIIISIALILPGISTSFMLLTLGIYDTTLTAISTFQLGYLFALGMGLLIGIFLTAGVLEKAMKRFPTPTYLIIIGFVLGSVVELRPGIPLGWEIPLCLVLFVLAAVLMNRMAKMESKS